MSGEGPAPRPWITANQVTVARLLPMPLITWLIYQGQGSWWPALALATVIGGTDYLDGYLARKQGPTVLGGLLDPIADKVFIALIYLPLADLGLLPMWLVGLMFVREFLVTAMRSAYAYRGVTFATSYLGKMKTWVQMQGVGMLVLLVLVERPVMLAILIAQIVIPALVVAVVWLRKRAHWQSGSWTVFFFAILTAVYTFGDVELSIFVSLATITALTWVSGLDYLVGGLRRLRTAKPWGRADGVRVVASIGLPLAVAGALGWSAAPPLPILAMAALELAVGGLDNLLATKQESSGARWWGLRTWTAMALCAAALLAGPTGLPWLAWTGPWAALVVCAAGVAREFWRGRPHYLGHAARHAAPR